MFSAHYKLDNLCAVIDYNGLQIDGKVCDVMNSAPIKDKLKAFGFNTIEINGHEFDEIESAFKIARQFKGAPTAIIANTIKGKGVSFMENQVGWHGVAPNDEQYEAAMKELREVRI